MVVTSHVLQHFLDPPRSPVRLFVKVYERISSARAIESRDTIKVIQERAATSYNCCVAVAVSGASLQTTLQDRSPLVRLVIILLCQRPATAIIEV